VRLHVFDPGPRPSACGRKVLRRMHRKIVVVDGQVAFVGGINYSADHLADYGPEAKQDYAVEMRGPLVAEIHRFAHAALAAGSRHSHQRHWWRLAAKAGAPSS
jgi:cardiolipin synthase